MTTLCQLHAVSRLVFNHVPRILAVEADDEKTKIRAAFQHWMGATCVRFQEVEPDFETKDHHILVTNDGAGWETNTKMTEIITIHNMPSYQIGEGADNL